MTKEEAVNLAISVELEKAGIILAGVNPGRAAIAAADKWDAEERKELSENNKFNPEREYPGSYGSLGDRESNISPGLDSAIQDELDHPPASIMEEGK